ncbi:MAG: hypothetical protein Q8Q31_02530 [Nanoarchaeota archaeon]|nr:hypothetical protein [Nanoarchaeota archaeon]
MNNDEINLPQNICTVQELRELREIVERKDDKTFKEKIEKYMQKFKEANPLKEKEELEKIALSYIGANCMMADRGYISIGIPYPPAPLGPVEKQFLRIYDPENYQRFKKIKWKRDWHT